MTAPVSNLQAPNTMKTDELVAQADRVRALKIRYQAVLDGLTQESESLAEEVEQLIHDRLEETVSAVNAVREEVRDAVFDLKEAVSNYIKAQPEEWLDTMARFEWTNLNDALENADIESEAECSPDVNVSIDDNNDTEIFESLDLIASALHELS